MYLLPSCLLYIFFFLFLPGYFLTKIFHPNVSEKGEICVNTLKRDWKPDTSLSHILAVIRCLLIVPFPESSLNDEAGKLFMESYDEYFRKAKLVTNVHAAKATISSTTSGESSTESTSSNEAKANSNATEDESKSIDISITATAPIAPNRILSTGTTNNVVPSAAVAEKRPRDQIPVASTTNNAAASAAAMKKKATMKRL